MARPPRLRTPPSRTADATRDARPAAGAGHDGSSTPPEAACLRRHVLRSIGANRLPGFHFPGHFMGIGWSAVDDVRATLTMADGPHLRNRAGAVDLTVLAVLADTALGTAARLATRSDERLGTIQLQAHFTGSPAVGALTAEARSLGPGGGTVLDRRLVTATMRAADVAICHASGEFVRLDPPSGRTLAPLPWQRPVVPDVVSPDERALTADERAILDAAGRALARAGPDGAFVERFWNGVGRRTVTGAGRRIVIGPHVGNRVGDVQGGISLGLAANTACDAAPARMQLANLTVWYVSPGRGAWLQARARVVHAGRHTALVRTVVRADSGRVVVEAVSQHAAGAGP